MTLPVLQDPVRTEELCYREGAPAFTLAKRTRPVDEVVRDILTPERTWFTTGIGNCLLLAALVPNEVTW